MLQALGVNAGNRDAERKARLRKEIRLNRVLRRVIARKYIYDDYLDTRRKRRSLGKIFILRNLYNTSLIIVGYLESTYSTLTFRYRRSSN